MEATVKTKDKLTGDPPKNKGGAPKKRVKRGTILAFLAAALIQLLAFIPASFALPLI